MLDAFVKVWYVVRPCVAHLHVGILRVEWHTQSGGTRANRRKDSDFIAPRPSGAAVFSYIVLALLACFVVACCMFTRWLVSC